MGQFASDIGIHDYRHGKYDDHHSRPDQARGNSSGQRNSPGRVPRTPPNRPPPKPDRLSSDVQTKVLLDDVGVHMTNLNSTIKDLKGRNPDEARKELHKLMSDTERDLHQINQHIQPQQQGRSPDEQEDGAAKLVNSLLSENDRLSDENKRLSRDIDTLKTSLQNARKNTDKAEERNTELLMRLSKVAGNKLVIDNPAIADLNDRNRPTKLGEMYSEIYDNEWTEAFEGLAAVGHDDECAIITLQLTLVNVLDFCKKKAETMLLKTEDAVKFLFEEYQSTEETYVPLFMTMPYGKVRNMKLPPGTIASLQNDLQLHNRWRPKSGHNLGAPIGGTLKDSPSNAIQNQVKKFRKEVAESMVSIVQKAYVKASWKNGEHVQSLKPFIKKCIILCWMMVVQSPPMSLHEVQAQQDVKFDKNMYKEYTISGPLVAFVVWPALLLHEEGPVVCKGVAQGCK